MVTKARAVDPFAGQKSCPSLWVSKTAAVFHISTFYVLDILYM